ncbi:MAG: 7-carboxy-7-deazaguanine synthase [Planctomycetales bacterium]|nr:7-carboxy-7-deazaguanine synthase [Planctomycetales bacterium]
MSYAVKEIVRTIQGEGVYTGRPAVFVRFTGCNLWSGRETDRQAAICQFCDTDFLGTDGPGGGQFRNASDLAEAAQRVWGGDNFTRPLAVCTGGEPLLQLDEPLVAALQNAGFEVAIETNGTRLAPANVDWICVSPKAGAELRLKRGNELKLVYPQAGLDPGQFESLAFDWFFLQPMTGEQTERNTQLTENYCRAHPRWQLSMQTHKLLGLP